MSDTGQPDGEKYLRPADPYPTKNEKLFSRKRGIRMNSKKFSEAMSELDSKYVDEAISYKKKAKKPVWAKWGAIAACFVAVTVLGVGLFQSGLFGSHRRK